MKPTPVKNPALVAHSLPALTLLGLPPTEAGRPELLEYFSGNWLLPGSEPAAHCYCGHQFGLFSGQLGDGCAMYVYIFLVYIYILYELFARLIV